MSAITVDGDLVHYEVLGRGGKPVILIHGWIGSWRYWIPTMRLLQLKYRVYAVDLFGFGDSGKNPAKYTLPYQITLLDEFLKQLGLSKVAIVSHGLGAMVAVEFANQHPDRVARVLVSSAPLFEIDNLSQRLPPTQQKSLMPPTKPPASEQRSGPQPLASKASGADRTVSGAPSSADLTVPSANSTDTIANPNMIDRELLRKKAMEMAMERGQSIMRGEENLSGPAAPHAPPAEGDNPLHDILHDDPLNLLALCFKRTEPEYEKFHADVVKQDNAALPSSALHFDAARMLDSLYLLPMPTLVAHGEDDRFIPAPSEAVWNYISAGDQNELLPVSLPGVRHFPMLEHEPFLRLVNDFLETKDVSKLEIKERWRRRTR
jgi:pimeloyl-ACP methyl ester carboxylesterase